MMDLVNLIFSGAQTVVGAAQLGLGMYQIYKEKAAANAQNFSDKLNAKNQENNISAEDFQQAILDVDPASINIIASRAAISDNDLLQEKYANLLSNSIAGNTSQLDMFLAILNQLSPKEVHLLDLYYKEAEEKSPIVISYAYIVDETRISGHDVLHKERYNYLTGYEEDLAVGHKELMLFNERLVSLGLFRDRRQAPELAFQLGLEGDNLWVNVRGKTDFYDRYQSLTSGPKSQISESYLVSTPLCDRLLEACN